MTRMNTMKLSLLAAAVLVAGLVMPAIGQQNGRQQRQWQQNEQWQQDQPQSRQWQQDHRQNRQWQQDRQQNRQWQQDRQQNPQAQQNEWQLEQPRGRQQQRRYQAEPVGWVRIAYDTDQDGQFEAYEYIFAYDLQRARQASQRRMQQQRQAQRGQQRDQPFQPGYGYQPEQRRMRRQAPQRGRIRGEIQSIKTVNVVGEDQPHLLVRLQSPDRPQGQNIARVDLGPKQQLEQLDLQQGDRIRVTGYRGTVNDQTTLIAEEVQTPQDRVRIRRQQPRELMRQEVTILDTRNVQFRGLDNEYVVAQVRLPDGRTAQANLGRRNKLQDAELSRGTELQILARPGRINGQPALIAEQIRHQEKTYKVNPKVERERLRRSRQQQNP